jgi:hypothetical protein
VYLPPVLSSQNAPPNPAPPPLPLKLSTKSGPRPSPAHPVCPPSPPLIPLTVPLPRAFSRMFRHPPSSQDGFPAVLQLSELTSPPEGQAGNMFRVVSKSTFWPSGTFDSFCLSVFVSGTLPNASFLCFGDFLRVGALTLIHCCGPCSPSLAQCLVLRSQAAE